MVWLQNHATKKELSPKLRQHWIGPYNILNKLSDVTYRIKKEPIGKPKVVHHNRLKPYCERLKPKAVSREEKQCEDRTKKGLSPKLRQHWIGPYKILNKLSDVTYRIKKEPIGEPKVVHHNRLKPSCERLKPKAVSRKKSSAKTEVREMYPTFLRPRRPPKRYGYD